MGIMDYPYHAFQAITWDKRTALGVRRDPDNPLICERVVVNLPGSKGYDCKRWWVYKEKRDDLIAADLLIYVDDGLPIGPTE